MENITTAKSDGLTQESLAQMLNVSQMTVSRALRGTGKVRPEIEQAIRAAASKHGYSAEDQFSARALQHKRHGREPVTNVVCAIINDAGQGDRHFNARILHGIETGALETGSELIISPYRLGGALPRVVSRRQVDGVVWLLSDADVLNQAPPCPVPFVGVLFSLPKSDLALVNDHSAMEAIGQHLAGLGHRRVAFVGPESPLAQARLTGLRAGLAAGGGAVAESDVAQKRYAMNAATTAALVRDVMARRQAQPASQRFTAIAVYNDYMAAAVIRCLQEEFKMRVPEDLSVTGFDGVDLAEAGIPRLTTAAIPLEDLGAAAARLIAWRMQHKAAAKRQVVMSAGLVVGETTGPAASPINQR